MIYVYDILLNYTDDMRILEFFEWNDTDTVEQIKRIPFYKTTTKFIDDVIKNQLELSKTILKEIKNKTEIFSNTTKVLKYAMFVSDGSKVVALELDHNAKVVFRSYLLLDEEEEILDISKKLDIINIDYKVLKDNIIDEYLTRKELFIKKFLLKEITYSYQEKNYPKISYLYQECYQDKEENLDKEYHRLIKDININATINYLELFKILTLKDVT